MHKQRFLSGVFILAIASTLAACSGQPGSASFAPAPPTSQSTGIQEPNANHQAVSAIGQSATNAASSTVQGKPMNPAFSCYGNCGPGGSSGGSGGSGGSDGVPGAGGYKNCLGSGPRGIIAVCSGGPSGGVGRPSQIACNGTAAQCAGISCSGSPETINDFFRNANTNASIEVTDINSIWQGGAEVGWMYLGSDNVRYYQANYSSQAGVSFGLSLGFAGGSVGNGAYSAIKPWTGGLPAGSAVQKCESQGKQLV